MWCIRVKQKMFEILFIPWILIFIFQISSIICFWICADNWLRWFSKITIWSIILFHCIQIHNVCTMFAHVNKWIKKRYTDNYLGHPGGRYKFRFICLDYMNVIAIQQFCVCSYKAIFTAERNSLRENLCNMKSHS
jgi:hypothetical protein